MSQVVIMHSVNVENIDGSFKLIYQIYTNMHKEDSIRVGEIVFHTARAYGHSTKDNQTKRTGHRDINTH